jgi:hypothetical protein
VGKLKKRFFTSICSSICYAYKCRVIKQNRPTGKLESKFLVRWPLREKMRSFWLIYTYDTFYNFFKKLGVDVCRPRPI